MKIKLKTELKKGFGSRVNLADDHIIHPISIYKKKDKMPDLYWISF